MSKLKLLSRREYEGWLKAMPPDYCAFCDWRVNQIVLEETPHWLWIANRAPYWRYHTMFVSKRHLRELGELNVSEVGGLVDIYTHAIERFRKAKLARADGTSIQKYVLFWRLRDNLMDVVSGNMRPDHFHIHLAPDKDHLWDPIVDEGAVDIDMKKFIRRMKR